MTTATLYAKLKHAKSEEDVKDIYIKVLGLKSYTKGLIDIRTDEIWFEAKDTGKVSTYAMFTQLLHYVQDGLNKGEQLPPLLAVIDTEKAKAVLNAGRELWQAYFSATDVYSVREELKLNRPDVGWYQIRNALKVRNTSGDFALVDFSAFEIAYKTLSEKLQPQVFELGFLRA